MASPQSHRTILSFNHLNRWLVALAIVLVGSAFAGEDAAVAQTDRGTAAQSSRSDEEIARYDDIVRRFGTSDEASSRVKVAEALRYKAMTLGYSGYKAIIRANPGKRNEAFNEAIAVCDDLVRRFGTATEPALRKEVAEALVYKGNALGLLDRNDEEIVAYDDVVRRFGAASEPGLREQVAEALRWKAMTLASPGRGSEAFNEALTVYDDLVRRFGTASEARLREEAARALNEKSDALKRFDRNEEAIAVYDDVVRRFGAAKEKGLREEVADALLSKGSLLEQLGRPKEAIAVYDDVIGRFGTAEEEELRKAVENARHKRGVILRQ
ncbi:tetratricopeptide repeat protein [Bradyrhizobium sp. UFLA05-109]